MFMNALDEQLCVTDLPALERLNRAFLVQGALGNMVVVSGQVLGERGIKRDVHPILRQTMAYARATDAKTSSGIVRRSRYAQAVFDSITPAKFEAAIPLSTLQRRLRYVAFINRRKARNRSSQRLITYIM